MNEYERVREDIVQKISYRYGDTLAAKSLAEAILSNPNIAVLADDQSLPRDATYDVLPDCKTEDKIWYESRLFAQQDILKAGWKKTVPKEKSDES